jgi:ABC-2 type transport system permease protein
MSRYLDAVRFEWVKFRSLRSLVGTLLLTIPMMLGLGVLFSYGQGRVYAVGTAADRVGFDPAGISLSGVMLAQVVAATLGVLLITSEFASGTIRTSLAGVPWRSWLLGAKATVLVVITSVAGALGALGAFLIGQPTLGGQSAPTMALGDPGVARAVLGAGLYLGTTALFGLALGVLIRSTAGALTIAMTVLVFIPAFFGFLPPAADDWLTKWWPSAAGLQLTAVVPDPAALSAWAGYGMLAGFVTVVVGLAFVVFRRRDA